ncbi:MAG: HNH endonuclease [Ilumatobacteraceae bacterium]|jgi:5-methylcytosine-specific restriction endonuclease McrA
MRSALVLNATYEPLSVVPARRAACLVLADKADIIEADGAVLHAASITVPLPLVIRLRYVVRVPYLRRTALSRRAVFARDEHRCQYCGGLADSIDHIMPRSRGGQHVWDNVAAACRPCNLSKRDRTPDEAGMRLARPARAPKEMSWLTVSVPRVPEAWKPYLAIAS